eukprot:SAG31_NODE_2489_length_5618_cov_2.136981_3_plen_110_part_00
MLGLNDIGTAATAGPAGPGVDEQLGGAHGKVKANELVDELLELRTKLRSAAVSKEGMSAKQLWAICDQYRDDILPKMGIVRTSRHQCYSVSSLYFCHAYFHFVVLAVTM